MPIAGMTHASHPLPGGSRTKSAAAATRLVLTGVLVAVSLLALAACSPEGEGILTAKDRNAFTELGEEYTALTNKVLDQMNAAAGKGDFSGVTAATDPLFADINRQIGKMEEQSAKLKGNPQAIADGMISIGRQWVTAAKSAIEAGNKSDETAYQAAISSLNSLSTQFNTKISEWNAIQAK